MADAKISALPAASGALLAQEIPANDAGTTRKVTVDQIIALSEAVANPAAGSTSTPGAGFATDTYLAGSRVLVAGTTGRGALKAGSVYRLKLSASKTAAGTGAPVFTVRYGTAGTTSDTAICTVTFAAGTAAVDTGFFEIFVNIRSVGSGTSATAIGVGTLVHTTAAATGLVGAVSPIVVGSVGSGFNSQTASAGIGCSLNAGASAAWTVALVQAELMNLN